jgi:hypothetical protein
MKKILLSTIFIAGFMFSKAQMDFSKLKVELGGNYTMYKSTLKQNTPGAKLRISVPVSEKVAVGLGFTYGFAIKEPSTVNLSPTGSVASEIVYNFKTISLEANYFLGEEKEEGFNAYGIFGAALVMVSYQ